MKHRPPTGHPIVDAIGQIEHLFIGPLTPYPWFSKILDKHGRPYHLAILLLAEIVGWYRPKFKIPKGSNEAVARKRFKRNYLQLNRGEAAKKFNTNKDTISTAITYLVRLGVIGREHRDLVVNGGKRRNLLFVWPVPKKVEELCEDDDPVSDSDTLEPSGVALIAGATWPSSHGPHTPDDGGDVAASKAPRGPADPGDVAPTTGAHTVTGLESDVNSNTTTTDLTHGPEATVVVVADILCPEANQPKVRAKAPAAQTAQRKHKPAAKASSPAKGAPRQTANHGYDEDIAEATTASGPEAEGDEPLNAKTDRFIEFYQSAHELMFGVQAKVTEGDRMAISNLIQQDDWSLPDLALVLLRAWNKIGKTADDGKYKFPCCQHSQRLSKFVQHFDRIVNDTNSGSLREKDSVKVRSEIARLAGFEQDEVERFFAPELAQELESNEVPELQAADVPDPDCIDMGLQIFVKTTPGIPFAWLVEKLIPYFDETYGPLPEGNRGFLLEYWRRYHHHEGCYSADVERDYRDLLKLASGEFDDAGVRMKVLDIVDEMLKQYRRWKLNKTGPKPTWPILANVLDRESIKSLFKRDELHDLKPT